MQTSYVDPFIPANESEDAALHRLSANIGTLSSLIQDAADQGSMRLVDIFSQARQHKVGEVRGLAQAAAGGS